MTKTFLVATDGSEGAEAAIRQAVATATAEDAKLVVLTVAPRGTNYLEPSRKIEEITEYARSEHLAGGLPEAKGLLAEDILTAARKIIRSQGELQASYISCAGDPAEEIVDCVHIHSADALYLGSRGLSRVGGFLLGSVSRRVSASAPCPIVIVPKQE